MKTIKTATLFFIISITVFGQKTDKYDLNWKIDKNDTLCYQTIMSVINNPDDKDETFSFIPDSIDGKELFKKLTEAFNNFDYETYLTNPSDSTINIVLETVSDEKNEMLNNDSLDDSQKEMLKQFMSNIMVRGQIYKSGEIKSFWLKSTQKNLIAILFELPTIPVSIGDTWELDVNLIQNDQSFICDSAYKRNEVTFIGIETDNNEKIAVIKYDIVEYVDGTFKMPGFMGKDGPTEAMMKLSHKAVGRFSIDKGKWISYDGIMEYVASGVMDAHTKTRLALIEKKVNKQ